MKLLTTLGNLLRQLTNPSAKAPQVLNIGIFGNAGSGKSHVLYGLLEWGANHLPHSIQGKKLDAVNTYDYAPALDWLVSMHGTYVGKGMYISPTMAKEAQTAIYEARLNLGNGHAIPLRFADIPGEALYKEGEDPSIRTKAQNAIKALSSDLNPHKDSQAHIESCLNGIDDERIKEKIRNYFIPYYFLIHQADIVLVCHDFTRPLGWLAQTPLLLNNHRSKAPEYIPVATKCDTMTNINGHFIQAINSYKQANTAPLIMHNSNLISGAGAIPAGWTLTSFCGSSLNDEDFVPFDIEDQDRVNAFMSDPINSEGVDRNSKRRPIGFHDLWLSILSRSHIMGASQIDDLLGQYGLTSTQKSDYREKILEAGLTA